MSAIRELFVRLTTKADTGALTALDKRLNSLRDGFGKFAAFLAGGFVANSVASFIKSQLDAADAISDTATKLGITTDEYERFGFIAKLSGSSAEEMGASIGKLNKAIGDTADGNANTAQAFSKLGVSLKNADGSARSTSDVFMDIANNFGSLQSQGDKTTVAMTLFGKGGQNLLPIFAQGALAIQEMAQRFEDLGGALPKDFISNASDLNDELDSFHFASERLKASILGLVLPSLLSFFKEISHAAGAIVNFEKKTHLISKGAWIATFTFGAAKLVPLAGGALKAASAVSTLAKAFGLFSGLTGIAALLFAAVAIEDIVTFARGGKSVIGDFLDALVGPEEAKAYAKELHDIWDQLVVSFKNVGPEILSVAKDALPAAIDSLVKLTDVGLRAVQVIKTLASGAGDFGNSIDYALGTNIDGHMGSDAEKEAYVRRMAKRSKDWNAVFDESNFGGIEGTRAIGVKPKGLIDAAIASSDLSAAPAQPTISIPEVVVKGSPKTGAFNQQNTINVKIDSTDPKEAAKETAKKLPAATGQMLRDAKGALARTSG